MCHPFYGNAKIDVVLAWRKTYPCLCVKCFVKFFLRVSPLVSQNSTSNSSPNLKTGVRKMVYVFAIKSVLIFSKFLCHHSCFCIFPFHKTIYIVNCILYLIIMPSCNEFIDKLLKENPDLTDKDIIARMKVLKNEKGKRLYKTSTIASKLRQFRARQQIPSELPEMKKVNFDDAKKEVNDAFGKRNDTDKKVKTVEPQEMESGHKRYDGRQKHNDAVGEKVDSLVGNDKGKTQDVSLDSVLNDIMGYVEGFDKRIEVMDRNITKNIQDIFQLKEGGLPVAGDELVDVQLQKSVIDMLDSLKTDDSQELGEIIVKCLIMQKNGAENGVPDFLRDISLDKNGSVHGKLFMHGSRWKFVKRMKPIIYGIIGTGIGYLSLFILLVLLRTLGLLPGWI